MKMNEAPFYYTEVLLDDGTLRKTPLRIVAIGCSYEVSDGSMKIAGPFPDVQTAVQWLKDFLKGQK